MEKHEKIIEKVQALRLLNLNRLIEGYTLTAFAAEHDLDATYLSQLRNKSRPFGEKSARKLEQQLGLPWFALDQDPEHMLSAASEGELLNAVAEALSWLSEDAKKRLLRDISQRL